MAPPEDAGPSGEHRALVAVTDALGLSAPATELVRAISKGIGNFSEAWLRRRNARADLDIYEEWKASLVNIDELPSSFEFSIDDRAAIRLKDEIRQKQFNRERVAVEAIEDYRGSEARDRGESGGESFDADWLNFYWQAAEQVSSRDMQSLWGRVLSRQASGERKYQLRTLDFLRTLSRSEAADITDLAGVAVQLDCQWGTGTGVLSRLGQIGHEIHDGELSDINERIRGFVRTANEGHLGSIGFFIESGWAYEFVVDRPDESFDFQIGDKVIRVSGEFPVNRERERNHLYFGSGLQISPIGAEVLTLTKARAQPEFVELVVRGLTLQGLSVEHE